MKENRWGRRNIIIIISKRRMEEGEERGAGPEEAKK